MKCPVIGFLEVEDGLFINLLHVASVSARVDTEVIIGLSSGEEVYIDNNDVPSSVVALQVMEAVANAKHV